MHAGERAAMCAMPCTACWLLLGPAPEVSGAYTHPRMVQNTAQIKGVHLHARSDLHHLRQKSIIDRLLLDDNNTHCYFIASSLHTFNIFVAMADS